MAQGETPTSVNPFWNKDAIIYETHVKTFCDSDGDGMGDFRGVIEKLDYLQELGITAICLLPFYPRRCEMTDTTSPITSTLIQISARWMISAHSLMRRINEICTSSRSWSSITLPIKTHGFKSRGALLPQLVPASPATISPTKTSMCGVIPRKNTRIRESFLKTSKHRTGHGTQSQKPIIGIAFIRISQT